MFWADVTHDVTGADDGFTVLALPPTWFPAGEFVPFRLSVATSFGSDDDIDTYVSVTPAGTQCNQCLLGV